MEALAQPKPNLYSSDKTSCWGRNSSVSRVLKWSTPQCLRCHFFNIDQAKELSVGLRHNWGTSRRLLKPKRSPFQKKHEVWKFVTVVKDPGAQTGGAVQHRQSHPAEPGWAVSQRNTGSSQGSDVTGAACRDTGPGVPVEGGFGREQRAGALTPSSKPGKKARTR